MFSLPKNTIAKLVKALQVPTNPGADDLNYVFIDEDGETLIMINYVGWYYLPAQQASSEEVVPTWVPLESGEIFSHPRLPGGLPEFMNDEYAERLAQGETTPVPTALQLYPNQVLTRGAVHGNIVDIAKGVITSGKEAKQKEADSTHQAMNESVTE